MGCAASSAVGAKRKVSTTEVTAITDDDIGIDYAVGFNLKANEQYGWGGNPSGEERDESDEFRVLRVSSLSGQVTLYVAGGKHKKPVQYDSDRLCPRAADQPLVNERCPFCPGNETKTPPNVFCIDADGVEHSAGETVPNWSVRVFPNIFPMLICPLSFYGAAHEEALAGIPHSVVAAGKHSNHKVRNDSKDNRQIQVDAIGASEVIVESPVHNALLALQEPTQICFLLRALVSRGRVLAQQPWSKQLLFFKQYGPLSGGSLVHPHTQVVSLPVLPPALVSRLEHNIYIRSSSGHCATCLALVDPFIRKCGDAGPTSPTGKLATTSVGAKRQSLPPVVQSGSTATPSQPTEESQAVSSRLVHLTPHFVVSVPYASSSQYSLTVAPRRHCAHFLDATPEELTDLSEILALLAQALYYGLDDPSYNIFIRTAPSVDHLRVRGREVGSEELSASCHWILEFRPRFPADLGGFEIASGVRVVSGLPEDHAAELRSWITQRLEDGVKPVPPSKTSWDFCRRDEKAASQVSQFTIPGRECQSANSRQASKKAWGPVEEGQEKPPRKTM